MTVWDAIQQMLPYGTRGIRALVESDCPPKGAMAFGPKSARALMMLWKE